MALPRADARAGTATSIAIWLALSLVGGPIKAADAELEAIGRARSLLAARGYVSAAVVVLEHWPRAAPSPEAFAANGRIYVNAESRILRATVHSREYEVVLASLILHEQLHLLGASEHEALEAELTWLTKEGAGVEFLQATRRAIADQRKVRKAQRAAGADGGRN